MNNKKVGGKKNKRIKRILRKQKGTKEKWKKHTENYLEYFFWKKEGLLGSKNIFFLKKRNLKMKTKTNFEFIFLKKRKKTFRVFFSAHRLFFLQKFLLVFSLVSKLFSLTFFLLSNKFCYKKHFIIPQKLFSRENVLYNKNQFFSFFSSI